MSSVTPSGPGPAPDDSVQETMVERGEVPPNVPNLLRVSPMDTTTATDVETSILDPVVTSDSFCRFVFLNKGILHSHSKVISYSTTLCFQSLMDQIYQRAKIF